MTLSDCTSAYVSDFFYLQYFITVFMAYSSTKPPNPSPFGKEALSRRLSSRTTEYMDDDVEIQETQFSDLPEDISNMCITLSKELMNSCWAALEGSGCTTTNERKCMNALFDHFSSTYLMVWKLSARKAKEQVEKKIESELAEREKEIANEDKGSHCEQSEIPETWEARTTCYVEKAVQATEMMVHSDVQTELCEVEDSSVQADIKPDTQERYTMIHEKILPANKEVVIPEPSSGEKKKEGSSVGSKRLGSS